MTLSCLAGCGSSGSGVPKQAAALDLPNWPELKALASPEIMKPIYFAKDMKDAGALKRALTSAEFGDALEKFAKSKIPSGYDSAPRKAAQEEVVSNYRKAIEAAKGSGAFKDMSDACDAAGKAVVDAGAPKK